MKAFLSFMLGSRAEPSDRWAIFDPTDTEVIWSFRWRWQARLYERLSSSTPGVHVAAAPPRPTISTFLQAGAIMTLPLAITFVITAFTAR